MKRLLLSVICMLVTTSSFASEPNENIFVTLKILIGEEVVDSLPFISTYSVPALYKSGNTQHYCSTATKVHGISVCSETKVVFNGVKAVVTPQPLDDGNISVNVWIEKSDLIALNTVDSNGLSIQAPELKVVSMRQEYTVENGKEISFPWAGYTVKLMAIR